MKKSDLAARLRRRPAVASAIVLLGLVALWLDSLFHLRRFIFLPGGDVGLGFRSYKGSLQWIEYAPWEPTGLIDFVHWSVPYWMLAVVVVSFLAWQVLWKKKQQVKLLPK
ncbi:MAG: hypothetical protein ABSA47_19875 [Verrucomicrobiota bacterium]